MMTVFNCVPYNLHSTRNTLQVLLSPVWPFLKGQQHIVVIWPYSVLYLKYIVTFFLKDLICILKEIFSETQKWSIGHNRVDVQFCILLLLTF